MKNTKWKDFRIGNYVFTVRVRRCSDFSTDFTKIKYIIFELHAHPKNWFEMVCETFRYGYYERGSIYEMLKTSSLEDFILYTCEKVIKRNEKLLTDEKDWKNF